MRKLLPSIQAKVDAANAQVGRTRRPAMTRRLTQDQIDEKRQQQMESTPFDPKRPRLHEDWEAVTVAIERVHAALTRMREYDGLGPAEPEASREHDELRERIVDLIEVGASYDLLQDILDKRRKRRGR
jgi:hypothetical protein